MGIARAIVFMFLFLPFFAQAQGYDGLLAPQAGFKPSPPEAVTSDSGYEVVTPPVGNAISRQQEAATEDDQGYTQSFTEDIALTPEQRREKEMKIAEKERRERVSRERQERLHQRQKQLQNVGTTQ